MTDPAELGLTTVQVTLGTAAGYELTVLKSATVSIVGDLTEPALTLAATTPVADEIAGTNGVFTVTRTGSTANALTAYYTIAGTAVDGTDYNLLPGSVTIPAGQASTTIIITPMSDPAMRDSSRTVTLNLTNYGGPSGASYSIGNPAGDTVTIDDLPTVTVQATTATAQEHELTAGVFTVTRANDPLQATQALTVNYTLTGTAVNGTNYQTLSGTVTIPAGQASATINVTPIDADVVGGSQTVALSLASGGYLIGSGSAPAGGGASDTVTINDDDLPTVGIQATTPTASEVAGTAGVFTVTRNGPTTSPLSVSYSVSGTGVAGTNYQPLSGSVTIPAGSATATINVAPINIGEVGGSFSAVATLSTSSAYWLTAVGPTPAPQTSDTVTILENDLPTVTLVATQPDAKESGTTGTFTVSRNGTTTSPLIVLYTIGGTAADGTDYQPLTGNVTIPAGQSSTTITVTPINDPNVEQDQTVTLTLAATSQYVSGSEDSDTATIFDDNPPSVTIAATANAVEQPATPGTFTVTRVGPTDGPLGVQYTVGGTAASGTDYTALAGTVTIPAGQSSATIDVTPLLDTGPETQQIVIPSATGGTYTLSLTSETSSVSGTVETTNTTAPLAYNASASAVQAALALLPDVGRGNVSVTGQGTTASPFIVQFLGGLVGVNIPQVTGDASQLTGTTSVTVATTTAGQRGFDQVEQVGYTAASNITGGTFTLSYNGNTTSALAYNASAATVQSAVQALPQIGAGNVAVTTLSTGPDTFTWQITFQGSLADAEVGQVTTNPGSITVSSGSASADDSIITYGSSQGGIDAVQQVTVNGAVGGTFTLTYQGATTAAIAYNAANSNVASALQALSTIGQNGVAVAGNAGGPWSITFQGSLADEAVPNLTTNSSALVSPPISTSISAYADGQRTVVVTLASSSTYTLGTLATPTASGGTGASDTVTITDPGNNLAPTVVATSYSTDIGAALSVAASGVLVDAQDPTSGVTLTSVLLTGPAEGSLTLNSDGSFTYTPDAGFQGTDCFTFQAYDGSLYSTPATVTINVLSAPAPQISVSDNGATIAGGGSVAFGQTYVGTAVTQTFTISNAGTAALDLSSWTVPSGFTIVTAPAATVAAGGSTTMTAQMNASTAGSYSGTFSIDDNVAGESPYTFTLSGTVVSPASALEVLQGTTALAGGGSFSFGTTGQGEALTDAFTVKNVGIANLTLADPISLPGGFALAQDFGATTLAPGAATTFVVELTASATGSYGGNLSFSTNDPNNATYHLALSGTVVATPIVEVLDGSTVVENATPGGNGTLPVPGISFGKALVGTALTQTFQIENNGTTTLDLTPSSLTFPTGFSVVTPYASSVAPGGSTTLVLQIDGSTVGVFSGTVSFPTNDVDNATFSFPVSGEIDSPEPQIEILQGTTEVAPGNGTINLGSTPVGTPVDVTLTVENLGTASLTIDQSMQLPSGFDLVSLGSTTIAPGGSTTLVLEMSAAFAGTYAGAVSSDTNDPVNNPVTFNLTGTVSAPQAQVTQGTTTIVNQTGSVDFGQTNLSTAVTRTFSVTNAGTANLVLTDPIDVPPGFSVASDFGSTTLAPGASTTFSIQLNANTAGDYQGALAVQTNDPKQALFAFNVSGEVGLPAMTVVDSSTTPTRSVSEGSADDFGSTPVGTPVQRTFTVTNTGTGMLGLSDPISLPAGFSLVSDFGSTSLAPGASTSFIVKLAAASAGFDSGNVSFGTNTTLLGTFQFGVSGGVAVPRLDVLEGTTDVTTTASPLDFGTTVVGSSRSEILTVKNTGTTNLVLSDPINLPVGFTLVSDFGATTLAPGASTTFTVALSAATAGDVSGSISFATNLSNVPTFSLPVQGEVIGLSNFRLWDDTGYSSTDERTSDPTVAGNLVGVPAGATAAPSNITVQFQVNNDGNVDGSVTADSTVPFTFTPVGLTPGAVTIDARVHLVDAVLGDIYTSWVPLSFTLETGTDAAPVVTNLALQTVTVPSASTPTSSDTNITGSVLNDGNVSYMTVQIDTGAGGTSGGQGQPDATVTTDANGNFLYQPQNVTPGTYTYQFRAVENAYPDGQIVGQWEPFTFTIVAPNAPVVDTLQLANVTGPGTNTTTDPTLTGHVTADGKPQQVEVDFQYNNDGVVDASVTANADGTFTFKPAGLPVGSNTIQVRAVNVDDNIIGAWTTIIFTLAAPTAPTVNTLTLLNVTGGTGSNITDDPTVTGTLTGGVGVGVGNITVQFDASAGGTSGGDGLPNGSTITDANGNFTWTPTGVNPGTVTIAARAVATDPSTGNQLIGAWKSITFTYSTGAGPLVSSLSLAHPTGTDQSTGLQTAIDATLTGTLTDGSELAAFLTVQYELNGDTQPDGSATTDAQGNFTFTPSGLAVGTDTVQVRGVTQDPQTGQEVDGAWTSITFELQQNPVNQAPVTPADSNSVTTADEVAATSLAASAQAVDTGIHSFNSAMGASSTPSGQISLGIGTYNALAGTVGGRVASGSIFDVENGSLPAPAGIGSGGSGGSGPSGPSLPSSSPLGPPTSSPLNVSNLATPTAGSGTITNQAIAQGGTLGPGNSDVTGTLNGSWNITVTADPSHSNVTDWDVTVNLSEAYANSLSGSYTDTSGAASINHAYADNVPGSYTFTFQATGTTTSIAGGPTIVAGTYTLVEGNSYSYSFSDSPVTSQAISGADSTSNETATSGGSHSFEHIETGGSLSTGAGLPTNGSYGGPAVGSTFVENEIETSTSNDGTSETYNNGSADGTDVGGSNGNDTFTYARNDYQTGTYNGAGGTLTENVLFNDETRQSDASVSTQTDNFNSSAVNGQVNGGSNATTAITTSFDGLESGSEEFTPTTFVLDPTFDDQQSYHESDQVNEAGSQSDNLDGVPASESFSYGETDNADQTDGEQGTDGANGTNFSASGSFSDSADANDQASYTDSGSYQGTTQGETVSGSSTDSASETDTATESDSGTFTDSNSSISDQGNDNENASSSGSSSSSGSDSASDPSNSYSDNWSGSGDATGAESDSGTFSDSPTLDSASGSLSLGGTADDTETESDQGYSTDASSSVSWSESVSDSGSASMQDTGSYTASDNPTSGSESDEVKGQDGGNVSASESDSFSVTGSLTGTDSYHFNEGGNDSAATNSNENGKFDDTDSSATGETDSLSNTFSDGSNDSSSGYYNDAGTSTGPSATTNYTDNDKISGTTAYSDGGTDQEGPTNDTSASFSDSLSTEEIDAGTATGTYTQAGMSGQFQAAGSDDSITSTSDAGSYDDGTTDTESDTPIVSDSSHDTFSEKDNGTFTGGQSGPYNDFQTSDDTETDSQSGSTTTTATGTSSSGTFNDTSNKVDTGGGQANQQQGSDTLSGQTYNSTSFTYSDNGTDTASGGSDSRTAGFSSGNTYLNTDSGGETGGYNGGATGSENMSASDGTLTTDSANGNYTSVSGSVTATGTSTDDALTTDSGSESENYPVGLTGSHGDSGSFWDRDQGHASGPFTEVNGVITAADRTYKDDDLSQSQGQASDTTTFAPSPGTTTVTQDTGGGTASVSYSDSGESSKAATGTSTDSGSTTTSQDNTSSATDTTTNTTSTGGSVDTLNTGDWTDYFYSGTYNISNGSEADSGKFRNQDSPGTYWNDRTSYTAPGDPGTAWESSDIGGVGSYNVDSGTVAKTNGTVTSETDHFFNYTQLQDDSEYEAISDKGAAGGVSMNGVPWLLQVTMGPTFPYNPPVGKRDSPMLTGTGASVTTSNSATAVASNGDFSADQRSGTTTDTNGTINTQESYLQYQILGYLDGVSQSSTGHYSDETGNWSAMSSARDSGYEFDTNRGSIDNGVTTGSYSNTASTSATTSSSSSWNATDSAGNTGNGLLTTNGTTSTSVSQTGDYTTEPTGTTIAPTSDNPQGWASSEEKETDDKYIFNQMVWEVWGTANGGSYSGTYAGFVQVGRVVGLDIGPFEATEIQDIDVAAGVDSRSVDYDGFSLSGQAMKYGETGDVTLPNYASASWSFSADQGVQADEMVSGDQPGTYSTTQDNTTWWDTSQTVTVNFWNQAEGGWQGAQTSSGSDGDESSNGPTINSGSTTAEPQPMAPGGGPVAQHVAFQAKKPAAPAAAPEGSVLGKSLMAYAGPTRVVGFMGGLEDSPNRAANAGNPTQDLVTAVQNALPQDHPVVLDPNTPNIYGSADGKPVAGDPNKQNDPAGLKTVASESATKIAEKELALIRQQVANLKDGEVYHLVLVGTSWGGDKSIEVANQLATLLRNDAQLARLYDLDTIQIHLVTLDAIGRFGSNPSQAKLTAKLASWDNIRQNRDGGWFWVTNPFLGTGVWLPKLRGGKFDIPGVNDKVVNNPGDQDTDGSTTDGMHAFFTQQVMKSVLEALGLQ